MTEPTARELQGLRAGFRIGKQVYVKVDLGKRYPKQRVTLGQLGEDLVVQPQRILRALVSPNRQLREVNAEAFENLFFAEGIVAGERFAMLRPELRPTLTTQDKREILEEQATGYRAFETTKGGRIRERKPSFYGWSLPETTIAVPLSAGMVDVLEKARRWEAIREEVGAYEAKLGKLADAVIALRKALHKLARAGEKGLHELGMLVGLLQYSELLLAEQGDPVPGDSPLADFHDFLPRVAIPLFVEKLVRNPEDLAPGAANRRDIEAQKIIDVLDDAELVAGVEMVVANHDVVSHELLDNTYHYLTAAADLLSVTPAAESFAQRHALPMMRSLADLPSPELDAIAASASDPVVRAAMTSGHTEILPAAETVYKVAMGLGTAVIGSVSNLAGPRSLGVAVMMQYQIHLFARGIRKYPTSHAALERAFAAFTKRFSDYELAPYLKFRGLVAEASRKKGIVNVGGLAEEAGLQLSEAKGPFRSGAVRMGTFLLASSMLSGTIVAFGADEERSWAAVLSLASAKASFLVAGLDVEPIASMFAGRVATVAGASLASFVCVSGLILAGNATVKAMERGDDLATLEGVLGTLGSGLSLLGWGYGVLTSQLAFVPSAMMTAGSILIFAGLGVSLWIALRPKSPMDVVVGTLEMLEAPDSRAQAAELGPTIATLRDLARSATFSPLPASTSRSLAALGYSEGMIAVMQGKG
jgi:hypothetical protein